MRTVSFWISLLLIFSIPWENVVEHPVLGSAPRLIGIALAVFWLATVVITRRFRNPGAFHFAALLFVLWNVVSVFWSTNLDATTIQLFTWLQIFILLLILWDLYDTRAALLSALQMYVLGCYVVVGSTIVNYYSGETYYYERFSATGTNPDDLGAVLALGIPVAFYLAIGKTENKFTSLLRLVNYAFVPSALLGIALSGTRTALIAAVPGLIFGFLLLTRLGPAIRVAVVFLMITASLILVPFIPEASFERLATTRTEISGGDLNGRIHLWRQGLASFAEHPLLGVGGNMFRSVNVERKVAHNSFISVLVELGIIGFTLFGVTLLLAVLQTFRLPRSDLRFWLTVLATWVIVASALTWEHRKPTWFFLSLLIASSALPVQRTESKSHQARLIMEPGERIQ